MNVDVVITGQSIPALVAALDCAEVGLSVCVLADDTGTEPPRQSVTDPDGHVRAMLERVAAPIEGSGAPAHADVLPRETPPETIELRDPSGAWAPLADPSVSGIPATPLDAAVIRLIGTKGAFRAYLDRIRPVLTVGKTKYLGALVRQRMGAVVLQRLVEPLLRERFGIGAAEIDVAIATPGLNEALTRQGALSTAVLAYAERNTRQETHVAPAGGDAALREELLRKLALYTVSVHDTGVHDAKRTETDWRLTLEDGTEVVARALVLDAGRSARATPLQHQLCPELTVQETRVRAQTVCATAGDQPPSTTRIEQLGEWSVRRTSAADGQVTVSVLSDVQAAPSIEPHLSQLEVVSTAATMGLCDATDWQLGTVAAPFATVQQREAAHARIDRETEADPFLLPIGQSLHGDDLGATLHDTVHRTLLLRRRLLGLID